MLRNLLALLVLAGLLRGATVITRPAPDRIHVEIDGGPFADFCFGTDTPKPYLYPLRTADGTVVTRGFPMEKIAGETTTDQHQRAVFLGYSSVNGFDFWKNEFSYRDPKAGRVETVRVDTVKDGISGIFRWLSPQGEPILEEARGMTFRGDGALRIVDVELALRALTDTTFGDSKDGAFGVRLAEPLIEKNGGVITNSAGGRGMKQTWGKPAAWVDYSGEIAGAKAGVALFVHPESDHFPPRWHVRDYGLLAVNPFGTKAFDAEAKESITSLKKGTTIRFRYRIVVHGAISPEKLRELYAAYAAKK